jgi:hypothetical protein
MSDAEPRAHWDGVYGASRADEVSWFQSEPELSLKLIHRTGIRKNAAIVDVGGGASTLVDHLLHEGYRDLTVLDIARAALEQAQARLGADADSVTWTVSDVTAWRPKRQFELWHDRAVLHFLTLADEQRAYADALRSALAHGGWAIIGGFAPNGPLICSGLAVVRHDAASLAGLLGESFELMETHGEIHVTPRGREQAFRYHVFERK